MRLTLDLARGDAGRPHGTGPANADLLARCRRGDAAAWDELVARHERLVHSVPLREGLSIEDAADVAQETFVELLRQLATIRDPERLSWWLMTVARRRSWRRREERRRSSADAPWDPPSTDDVAVVDDEDDWVEAVWVHDAIGRLEPACRDLVHVLFLDPTRPSYAEVAQRLDLPIGSIGPARRRCLACLERLLKAGVA